MQGKFITVIHCLKFRKSRMRKNDKIIDELITKPELLVRVALQVIPNSPNSCWQWNSKFIYYRKANVKTPVYSYYRNRGQIVYPHVTRILFRALYGEHTHCVCHWCDNHQCVNPRHLLEGNAKLNGLDKQLPPLSNDRLTLRSVAFQKKHGKLLRNRQYLWDARLQSNP